MTALLHRILHGPARERRLMQPSATVRDVIRLATGRAPAGEIEARQTWASLKAAGWRVEDVPAPDHLCAHEGCEGLAVFGFARPGGSAMRTCGEHRDLGEAHIAPEEAPARAPVEVEAPRQGGLFG